MVTVSRVLGVGVISSERKLQSSSSALCHFPTVLLAQGKRTQFSGRWNHAW